MKFTIEEVAKLVHEINKLYCAHMGDYSLSNWKDSPSWQKESIISGIKNIIQNPNQTPEESHNKWLKYKEEEGWKYGNVKDSILKTHPCFLPYNDLPEQQKLKDIIFISMVKIFLPYIIQ